MYHIKKDKRSIQSGNLMYEALGTLMRAKKFEDISIKELMDTAQVGRATFYRNFDIIEDILRWKCDEAFQWLYEYLVEFYKAHLSRNKQIKFSFMKPFLRYWYIHSEIIELLYQANHLDIVTSAFQDMFKKFNLHIPSSAAVITDHFDYFAALRSGVAINILIQWIKNDKDIAPDDLADLIANQIKASMDLMLLI